MKPCHVKRMMENIFWDIFDEHHPFVKLVNKSDTVDAQYSNGRMWLLDTFEITPKYYFKVNDDGSLEELKDEDDDGN